MVTRRRSTTVSFLTISTTFTSTKPIISTSRTLVLTKITATISSTLHQKRSVIRCFAIINWYTLPTIAHPMFATGRFALASTTPASFATSTRAFHRTASTVATILAARPPIRQTTRKSGWRQRATTTTRFMRWSSTWARKCISGRETDTIQSMKTRFQRTKHCRQRQNRNCRRISVHDPKAWTWRCRAKSWTTASRLIRFTIEF